MTHMNIQCIAMNAVNLNVKLTTTQTNLKMMVAGCLMALGWWAMNKTSFALAFTMGMITTVGIQHVRPIKLHKYCAMADKVTVNKKNYYFGCYDRDGEILYSMEPARNQLDNQKYIEQMEIASK